MKFFAPDSKFMTTMNRLGDLILLNFFFLLTCIPIFTIGAAWTALYTVTFRMGTDREQGALGTYFRAFRDNFKQSTALWLLMLFCMVCTAFDLVLFLQMRGAVQFLFFPFAVLLLLAVLVAGILFPLLSQFHNTNRRSLKNALLLSVAYLPRSLMLAVMNLFPFVVLLADLMLFLQTGFLWVFLYFSSAAYLGALLLKKVFAPFRVEEA